ncbi:MAG: lamin tail domain-containing protein [Phycisphaerales bacterium]|nr:lamin tail domain-containing protein [Phycisphaerales bacterium]
MLRCERNPVRAWATITMVSAFAAWASASALGDPAKPAPKDRPAPKEKSVPAAHPAAAASAVPFPHPLITEVLFAVPTGQEGDANADGVRDALGDEFVEIANPNSRPIDLRGYTLLDGSANPRSRFTFTFPAMIVPPGGVVVAFNGHKAKIPGAFGDAKAAPKALNPNFHNAAVFSVGTGRAGFSNAGDVVVLKAPDGKLVQRVRWGNADEAAGGTGFLLDELVPASAKSSVQREGMTKDAAWRAQTEIDGKACSPGKLPDAAPAAPAGAPAQPAESPSPWPKEETKPEQAPRPGDAPSKP